MSGDPALRRFVLLSLLALSAPGAHAQDTAATPRHAYTVLGEPALPPGFTAFPYVNPDAPKGGEVRLASIGTFDGFNPFILRGTAEGHGVGAWVTLPGGSGSGSTVGHVWETLLTGSADEVATGYGHLAESIEVPADKRSTAFTLRPEAKFSDGTPVTAEDVAWTYRTLLEKGRPSFRIQYADVKDVVVEGPRRVRFNFKTDQNRDLPLIVGGLPVLPRHFFDGRDFTAPLTDAPVGSGPYRVSAVKPGAGVTLTRNPDYWGRDLPVNRGLWNFDEIRLDFYREANGQFEAFKRGLYDFRVETEPLRWHDGYDFPAARNGEVIRETIKTGMPQPSEFLVFNTRRPVFSDIRVRQALTLLFDFEWINRNYFFGLYGRSASFFAGSELSAYGRAADAREQVLLKPFAAHMPPDILDGSYHLPVSDGSGRDRATLRSALALLSQAGYDLDGTVLRQRSTKAPLSFEILVATRDQERIALAYMRDLKRAGIEVSVRAVDAVQFDQRRLGFEFDMIQNRWDQSLSPGNEQSFYWGSEAADLQGTRNYMGAKDPAIDVMIAAMLEARERPAFLSAVRALDRTLMSGFYAIPLFNVREQWIARWNRIERPGATALTGYLPETWWQKPDAQPK